jgi:hypothetical protein
MTDALYITPDTSRYYVTWSQLVEGDFGSDYWPTIYDWFAADGCAYVADYLLNRDVSKFNPKASPPKTDAFWVMAQTQVSTESTELDDLLDMLGRPEAVTLAQVVKKAFATSGFEGSAAWFSDRTHRFVMSKKFGESGYTPFKKPNYKQGLWVLKGRKQIIYVLNTLNEEQKLKASTALAMRENNAQPQSATQSHTSTSGSSASYNASTGYSSDDDEVPF